jgi:hypothetical protein
MDKYKSSPGCEYIVKYENTLRVTRFNCTEKPYTTRLDHIRRNLIMRQRKLVNRYDRFWSLRNFCKFYYLHVTRQTFTLSSFC